MSTSIEWTDETWNPSRGCSLVSPGCVNCYAMKFAHRFSGHGQRYENLTKLRTYGAGGPVWTGDVRFVPEMLGAPLGWKRPRRVFVNSMSDLFHLELSNEQIASVFGVMAACPHHTFQILTKRPGNMLAWFDWIAKQGADLPGLVGEAPPDGTALAAAACTMMAGEELLGRELFMKGVHARAWPLPNVWLGVSVEDQQHADARIPLLLKAPASVHFISAEPLLGPISFRALRYGPSNRGYVDGFTGATEFASVAAEAHAAPPLSRLDWVIVGGESGPGARLFDVAWAHSIVEQCKVAGVACFVKQLGRVPVDGLDLVKLSDRKGGVPSEWPEALRVRQFPEVRA